MRNNLKHRLIIGCMATLCCGSLLAQAELVSNDRIYQKNESSKRLQNFQELKSLGYTEKEIYEDLGNAHFLSNNYETALFWYDKLIELSEDGQLEPSYQKRYDHAVSKLGSSNTIKEVEDENWTELVRSDYQMTHVSSKVAKRSNFRDRFKPLNFSTESGTASLGGINAHKVTSKQVLSKNEFEYETPIVVTKDGNTAYFSKAVMVKPTTGIFSKKEKIHKIYKADKVDGQWRTIQELALCPSNYSALHPAISPDGKRLFFASNMPGAYGKYDIYVSNISKTGTIGIAKNLGEKVNTVKNDIYPKVIEGNTLVFASEGHKGYGGLDVYMVEVGQKNVGLAINLGSPINSKKDEFSIQLANKDQMAYVISNRGQEGEDLQKVAFSYIGERSANQGKDYHLLEALNSEDHVNYSTSVFEDEQ
ncbi:cell envelope biogenesis protein OmpA [Maribacter sp. CXY002]|uniref:cell envelope biogenesis protein OmpA n=1 Tax=Maribacter luteocoastalis TaxID=3407671 RepID=UPI003B68308F